MPAISDPSPGEVLDALRDAVASSDQTVQELLRVLVLVTRLVHPKRPAGFWENLPEFGGR